MPDFSALWTCELPSAKQCQAALHGGEHVEPSATCFAQGILHWISSSLVAQGVQQPLQPFTAAIRNLLFGLKENVR
jgi:hypothetical protein